MSNTRNDGLVLDTANGASTVAGSETGFRWVGAHALVGKPVRNPEGEEIGVIKEVMLDIGRGCASYVVVSMLPAVGTSPKLFVVPWESVTQDNNTDTDAECFVVKSSNDGRSTIWCITGLEGEATYPHGLVPAIAGITRRHPNDTHVSGLRAATAHF
jgi:sporulation protein YlmC with PRC-barrel domain